MVRIALDAMGGDHAPGETVLGGIDAVDRGINVVLVGDAPRIEEVLDRAGRSLPIVHAPEHVDMGEDPGQAIREKRGASVSVAARLVAEGEAQGMVSAGSTGAALAAAAIVIGRIRNVSRPALATIYPIGHGMVVLDVGANLEVRPEHLAQFGVMGSVLAPVYLGIPEPTVGLLNIGEESGKGRTLERQAHEQLSAMPIRFVGNVEGTDLGRGRADVFVTDGFTGNVLLKASEGTAQAVSRLLSELLGDGESPQPQIADEALVSRLRGLQQVLEPEAHGGAHLVGARGTVVVAHGSSSRVAVSNALALAAEGAEHDLAAKIEAALSG